MIHDPAIQELINGGPEQFLTRRQKLERYLSWFLLGAVALLAVGYFAVNAVANQANAASNKANAAVQGSCQFWHDLSILPLSPTSTKTGFTIVADARIAYAYLECPKLTGDLPAPDPRVKVLLPKGVR